MNRKYAPLVVGIALVGTLATACSDGAKDNDAAAPATSAAASASSMPGMDMSSGSASESASAVAVGLGTETASAELRAGLTALLQEHVYLAGIATGTALNRPAGPNHRLSRRRRTPRQEQHRAQQGNRERVRSHAVSIPRPWRNALRFLRRLTLRCRRQG